MKLRQLITHTVFLSIGLAVGVSVASYYFLFKIIPDTTQYVKTDIEYIDLPNTDNQTQYYTVLQEFFLGDMYLRDPIYFFQRDKGQKILESLVERGYTPAADLLWSYHLKKAFASDSLLHGNRSKIVDENEYNKAHKWAVIAAEQGSLFSLFQMIRFYGLPKYKDITEEVKLMEKTAKERTHFVFSDWLMGYYEAIGNTEKAKYWEGISEAIASDPNAFIPPQIRTIKPWRG